MIRLCVNIRTTAIDHHRHVWCVWDPVISHIVRYIITYIIILYNKTYLIHWKKGEGRGEEIKGTNYTKQNNIMCYITPPLDRSCVLAHWSIVDLHTTHNTRVAQILSQLIHEDNLNTNGDL